MPSMEANSEELGSKLSSSSGETGDGTATNVNKACLTFVEKQHDISECGAECSPNANRDRVGEFDPHETNRTFNKTFDDITHNSNLVQTRNSRTCRLFSRPVLHTDITNSSQTSFPDITSKPLYQDKMPNSTLTKERKGFRCREVLHLSNTLDKAFESHGRLVAHYPCRYIFVCIVIGLACASGLYFLKWETNIVRLWNPENSESGNNFQWLWKNHPPDLRRHNILFQARNILSKENIKRIFEVRQSIHSMITPSGHRWYDVCLKVPIVPEYLNTLEDTDDPFDGDTGDPFDDDYAFNDESEAKRDPLISFYPKLLCSRFNSLKSACLEDSILELFGKDGNISATDIEQLTNDDIVNAINTRNISEMFSVAKDFKSMLGNVQYNSTGHIVSARVASLVLYGKMNVSEANLNHRRKDVLGNQISIEQLDEVTEEIESELIKFLDRKRMEELSEYPLHEHSLPYDQVNVSHKNETLATGRLLIEQNIAKSFQEAVNERIMGDIPKVLGSFLIMFTYISLTLGKLDCVENRVFLSWAGLSSIILAMVTSYGLCSFFGFVVSPLHNFIPFLLLGLGVDDMFVIVQALDYYTCSRSTSPSRKRNIYVHDDDLNIDGNINPENIVKNNNAKGDVNIVERKERGYVGTKNLSREIEKHDAGIDDKLAETMKHSGVSITVTSLTDFLAFAIGGTTSIPALKSFCMFCGLGILSVYVYQTTWFVAWLVIDEKRKSARRNGFIPCITHTVKNGRNKYRNTELDEANFVQDNLGCIHSSDLKSDNQINTTWRPRFKSKITISKHILRAYGQVLSHIGTQITIILITVAIFVVSIYGNIQLKQEFDPYMFLPPDSSIKTWVDLHRSAFPSKGEQVILFFEGPPGNENGNLRNMNLSKIEWLVNELRNQDDIVSSVDSWYSEFKEYYRNNFKDYDYDRKPLLELDSDVVSERLVQFLFSRNGLRYTYLIDCKDELKCGGPLPHIQVHIMSLTHKVIETSPQGIEAMNRVKSIVKKANFNYRVFPFSPLYSVWEIDEIIRGELYRNLGLATLAVYLATLLLLSDFRGSLFCLLSVFLTLTNVSGLMYFWGLTIDTVTSTVLIICIGLSVDFAAHVVHSFMQTIPADIGSNHTRAHHRKTKESNKKNYLFMSCYNADKSSRMRESLEAIAPAILHGGLSTLLAVVLLAFSDVYVFQSFFKIFVLVVLFGLYNGLVVLPVLLANFGPNVKKVHKNCTERSHNGSLKVNQISLQPTNFAQHLSLDNDDTINEIAPQTTLQQGVNVGDEPKQLRASHDGHHLDYGDEEVGDMDETVQELQQLSPRHK